MMGIDFLHAQLAHKMEVEFETLDSEPSDRCACCGRAADEWMNSQQKVLFKQGSSTEIHCLPCHALYHPSFKFLGQEGLRKGKPVAHKLGMLKGCGALITENYSVLYAPGKYYQKFVAAKDLLFDEVVEAGGKDADIDVMQRPPETPLLYIKNFGVVKQRLINSLQLSHSPESVYFCDGPSGTSLEVPRSLLAFARELTALDSPSKWLTLFKASATRYLRESEARELHSLTTQSMQRMLTNDFPEDPFWRRGAATLLEALIQ